MNDQSLGDTTPAAPAPSSTMSPFGDPTSTAVADDVVTPPAVVRQWTIEEILGIARPPERHARICLRADLEAERAMIRSELLTLVDAQGKVIDDDEDRPMGAQSKAGRARELAARLETVESEMAAAMWYPLLRGLTSDALTAFNEKYLPKKDDADMTEYHTRLIAECSVTSVHGPKLSVDDVRSLRATLGANAMGALTRTAREACTKGGTDFPQSLPGLAALRGQ